VSLLEPGAAVMDIYGPKNRAPTQGSADTAAVNKIRLIMSPFDPGVSNEPLN